MNERRTYDIDGWTFEACNDAAPFADYALNPSEYWVSMVLDDGFEPLGKVRSLGPKRSIADPKIDKVPMSGMHPDHIRLPGVYATIRNAISDLAREWDRQIPSRSQAIGRPRLPAALATFPCRRW